MIPMTARRAQVGDRMRVDVQTREGFVVNTVITVDAVHRLGCGCDAASYDRPGLEGPCPRVEMVPISCHHTDPDVAVNYDKARASA